MKLFFTSPWMFAVALLALACAGTLVRVRRSALPPGATWLFGIGGVLLALAAGGPVWQRPSPGQVSVMVDLSPSTRTAAYRHRDVLDRRIKSLLGKTPYRVTYFAESVGAISPDSASLPDLPAEKTIFAPPTGAAAVLLFSDGRFEIPSAAPPTYVVLDPILDSPADAAVTSLQIRGDTAAANVSNDATARRRVSTVGTLDSAPADVGTGSLAIVRKVDPRAGEVMARLSPGDAWPENDQLSAIPPPPEQLARWWVGGAAPSGWRGMAAADLPTDAAEYLNASVIVLENVAATDLNALQQQRLGQYVYDLGGGLVILGGDRAFAAGAYPGSLLEALSPLASTPPNPTTHWLLLADGSGSMAEMQGGVSLWQRATDAIVRLIPHLPADDLLNVGSFSDALTWWSSGKSVRQTSGMTLPPAGTGPHGPTNLEDTLLDIAHAADGNLATELLLLTDADAEIKDPLALATEFRKKKIRLHLLAIADGSGLSALRVIISATGGTLVKQFDPLKWADAIQTLQRSGLPRVLQQEPLLVRFSGDLALLSPREMTPWNKTWKKDTATALAQAADASGPIFPAARWNAGNGRVMALAFDPGPGAGEALARAAGQPPRDPRYRVRWECGRRLHVGVDAIDGKAYLNGKGIQLDLSPLADSAAGTDSHAIAQTGPGQYELDLPAPRTPMLAAVRVGAQVIERVALAGRYAPEFDAIGNDHDAMRTLASRTGGQVIPPRQIWPIDFRWPKKTMPMTSIFAILGAAGVALGLAAWKVKG